MPTIRVRNTAAAGAITVFPLQGNQYEYLPFNARVEFAIVGHDGVTGGVVQSARATVFSGSDILQQQGPITDKSAVTAQSQDAVYPDDFLWTTLRRPGSASVFSSTSRRTRPSTRFSIRSSRSRLF